MEPRFDPNQYGEMSQKDKSMIAGQKPKKPRELTDFEKNYATNPNRMATTEEMRQYLEIERQKQSGTPSVQAVEGDFQKPKKPRELTDFEKNYATNPNRMATTEEMRQYLEIERQKQTGASPSQTREETSKSPEIGNRRFTAQNFIWSQLDDGRDYRFLSEKADTESANSREIGRIIDYLGFTLAQNPSIKEAWLWFSFPPSTKAETCCAHLTWGKSRSSGRKKAIIQAVSMSSEELLQSGVSQADMTQSAFWKDAAALQNPVGSDLSSSAEISFGKFQPETVSGISQPGEIGQEDAIAALYAKTKENGLSVTDSTAIIMSDSADTSSGAQDRFHGAEEKLLHMSESLGIEFATVIEATDRLNT